MLTASSSALLGSPPATLNSLSPTCSRPLPMWGDPYSSFQAQFKCHLFYAAFQIEQPLDKTASCLPYPIPLDHQSQHCLSDPPWGLAWRRREGATEHLNELTQDTPEELPTCVCRGSPPPGSLPRGVPTTHHQLQVAHALSRVLPQATREQGKLGPGWHSKASPARRPAKPAGLNPGRAEKGHICS